MRTLLLLVVLWFPLRILADTPLPLTTYLAKALPSHPYASAEDTDPYVFVREVELRVSTEENKASSAVLRISPFAWNERSDQFALIRVEKDLNLSQELETGSAKSFEIGRNLLSLQQAQKKVEGLIKLASIYDQLIRAYEANPSLIVEKPDSYIKFLEERQEAQEQLQESNKHIQRFHTMLAQSAGLASEGFRLSFDELLSLDDLRIKTESWSVGEGTPGLRAKTLLASKADLEAQLQSSRQGIVWNYFDIGKSLKSPARRDGLEFEFGVSIPLFSGRDKARELELQRNKSSAAADILSTRAEEYAQILQLKSQILLRLEQLKGLSIQELEVRIQKIQKRTNDQIGSFSLSALNIRLALEKLRLRQLETSGLAWLEFLELARLMGHLDPGGRLLLARSRTGQGAS